MKWIIGLVMFGVVSSASAQSLQCLNVAPGTLVLNHKKGIIYGANFYALVSCTRYAPTIIRVTGGLLCKGYQIYGRPYGRSYSCTVRKLGWR